MAAGARVVAALRAASYDRYPTLVASEHLEAGFPFPRSFQANNVTVKFTYTAGLEDKRVFRALVDEAEALIYVKFTLRYSGAARNVAARLGFALKLLGIKRVQVWWIVVMEDVSGD